VSLPITFILTLLILLATSLGIGSAILHLARHKLKLHPAESLCLAVALSWLVVFQCSFAAFVLGNFSSAPIPLLILTLIGFFLGRAQIVRWLKNPFTRSMLAAFSLLLAWNLLHQASIITYGWGQWYGDWFEHYERMLFYCVNAPLETRFLNEIYTLAARPPMQNICQAYVASFTDRSFPLFQVSSTFLATLLSLPVFLLVRRMARAPGVSVWVAAALLALSWPILVASLFTWTKAFAGFYALTALALYLRPSSRLRDTLVFLLMGTGVVVHYSDALILIPLLLWHAGTYRSRPRALPAAIVSGIPGIIVLLPWIIFIKVALSGSILGSTSTAQMAQNTTFSQGVAWALQNALCSLVPFFTHDIRAALSADVNTSTTYSLRAALFMATQHTWVLAIGFTGLFMTAWEATRACLQKKIPPQASFWLWIVIGSVLCTAFAHMSPPSYGLAHIALCPLIAMTAAWIAGAWPTFPRPTRLAMVALALLQALIILFDAYVSSSTPRMPDGTPFPGFDLSRTCDIQSVGIGNLALRYQYKLTFLADSLAPHLYTLWLATVLFAIIWLTILFNAACRRSNKHLKSNL
jgi:hypothetical protein